MGFFNKKNKKKELTERLNAVIRREEDVEARETLLENKESDFLQFKENELKDLKAKFSELENDRTDFESKRIEYEPKFQEALNNFANRNAENEADIQKRISDISESLLKQQKEFSEQLQEAHQKSEKEHEELLLAQTQKRLHETDEELSSRRNTIAEKESELRERELNLDAERNKLNQDIKDYEQKDSQLEAEKAIVQEKKASLDQSANDIAQAKITEYSSKLDDYKNHHERLSEEVASLESQILSFNEIKNRLNGEDPLIILVKLQSLERELADAHEKLSKYPDNVLEEIQQKQDRIDELNELLDESKSKLIEQAKISSKAELSELKNASLETNNNILKQDNERLETLNAEQAETIKHYRELYDKEATYSEKIKSLMMPHDNFTADKICRKELILGHGTNDGTEENIETEENPKTEFFNEEVKWLESVSKKIADYGLDFSQRILYAFHTALKTAEWSPLAVLAGVSGTGKSELPQLYAKFGGINCVNIPVQPNWDGQEALLGYYNSISSKFEAQPLLQFLVQSQLQHVLNEKGKIDIEKDTSLKDQVNIVLLDEMNLAHIEQYFAEFLSKLEERRGKKEDDPQYPALAVKLGGTDSYPLPLGRNVLWVGTMNQDETTKSLSDKVLDRGIVINFPRPNSFKRRVELNSNIPAEKKYLAVKTWDSWKMVLDKDKITASEKIISPYKEFVEEINKTISNIGRAIGHRVWQSIENYIWNYPTVRDFVMRNNDAFVDDSLMKDLTAKIDPAFEDQLVQKIMPKLRGIETRGESKKVLEEIRNKIEKFKGEGHTLNITKDFDNAIRFGDGQFLWVTSEYLNKTSDN